MAESVPQLSDRPIGDGRIGIIDIGSNSIRLVIYDQQKRSPVPIYNEKVMCALGKALAATGTLNPEGVDLARAALKRFLAMGNNMGIASLHVMATAAIRDARDGQAFARYLEDTYRINVDIISGKKEARLGAHGVCASMYRPQGITGDLGGGSIELVNVEDGEIRDHASLPLGSLRMIDESKGDRDKLRKLVEKRFAELTWMEDTAVANFYAIGGSFRALARMHMTAGNYPLHILHEYKVDARKFLDFARDIAAMPEGRLEKFPGAAPRRVPALPGAAIVLEHIIAHARPDHIVFSTSGIREGYLYEKLPPAVRSQDGLLASCTEFATKGGRSTSYANELFTWMYPLLDKESEKERRLRLAFCLLSDIALHIHPEYRAPWAFHRILQSALTGLTHRERVKLSLALYHRYQFKLRDEWAALKLLKSGDREWARLVGSAANLAYHVCGSIAGNLHNTSFVIEKNELLLQLSGAMQDVLGDAVKRRMDGVREAWKEYGF
ncbi:MAG: Ppx/GppA family phosphatase [Pseudomonadota bacterium]|nr:Ppx/GppA family phosphatase [Pseudomonadota bacterium]MDE3038146.1 Ppx/GppA family phosphatase [Pseudomonadota bacterium]